MAKKQVVKQRYFVAAQSTQDGKTVLTLLAEGKDSTSCQAIMRSQEFVDTHMSDPSPVRVCILRDEPAIRIRMKPNALAQEISEALTGGPQADRILSILAKHKVPVSGEVEAEEVVEEMPEPRLTVEEQEGAQEESEEPQAPETLESTESAPSEDVSPVPEPPRPPEPPPAPEPQPQAPAAPPPPGYGTEQAPNNQSPPGAPPQVVPPQEVPQAPKPPAAVPPPPPVAPPPAVAPDPMVKGENKSGQAPPAFGGDFGVPPLPPPESEG
jgi:hypothetical protein